MMLSGPIFWNLNAQELQKVLGKYRRCTEECRQHIHVLRETDRERSGLTVDALQGLDDILGLV